MTASFASDCRILTHRSLRHILRSPDTVITTVITPIAMLLLFVYVFGGAIEAGDGNYVDYLVPGILLITVASGVAYTALRLFTDLSGGICDRFRTMPIAPSSFLWAHVLTSLVANLLSMLVVVVVAFVIGFRPSTTPTDWLAALTIIVAFTLALTWLAVAAGLTATSAEGAGAFAYPLVFLPFVSSAFVPTNGMPRPVEWFAEHQPITSIVDTLRDLFAGEPADDLWVALGWCGVLLIAAYTLGMWTYRRRLGGSGPAH